MVYLSGALLPKSSKSLCLQKEGVESPPVNLDFEGGKPIQFWLKGNLEVLFLFSDFWDWDPSRGGSLRILWMGEIEN